VRPDVRQLAHFVAVAEELNFTRAAERAHLVQQALSASIAQLERHLGVKLLERSTRRVALTDAGRAFLEPARDALASVDRAVVIAEQHAAGQHGRLRVGLCATAGLALTPRLLSTFNERYPRIDLEVRHFDFADPRAGVASGLTDVAIVRPPFQQDHLRLLQIGSEPRSVVLSAGHRLARRESVRFGELLEEPWMDADTDRLWCSFWRGDEYRERPAPIGATCSSFDELFEAVRSNRATGLVPASIAKVQAWPGLAFVPVADIAPSTTAICWRAEDRRAALGNFVEIANELLPT
jgi:DNA-binding transcriptional LysR family regulator